MFSKKSVYIACDVESDGPAPWLYSMICFGAVVVEEGLDNTFYGELAPISNEWEEEALAVSGFTRAETLAFPDPAVTMKRFEQWIDGLGSKRIVLASDNNGYDWMFICWYLWKFCGRNMLGWSSKNINNLAQGLMKNTSFSCKKWRKTPHDHNPLNDAKGNAEILLELKNQGIKF